MAIEVKIPALGESISSGILTTWHVNDGDFVEEGQTIYELETDKITQEGAADSSGTISLKAAEGEEVEIGAIVAIIDETATGSPASAPVEGKQTPVEKTEDSKLEAKPKPEDKPQPQTTEPHLSPAVRKIVDEHDLIPTAIEGSGKDGRITKADAVAASKASPAEVVKAATPVPTPRPAPAPPITPAGTDEIDERVTRKPLSPIRRKIASRLVEAQQTAAILTTFNEADMSAIISLRKQHQENFVAKNGIKLGFMSFFVKAVVHALKAVPELNVRMEGANLVQNHYFDIGVAVGTKKGLVVPVVRDCDKLSFAEIEQTIVNYAHAARDGKITLQDMQGGCFTITNGGIYGSMLSTPILNPPQSGILGMHAIQQRPMAENGEVVVRPMMYLAVSYDHRVVDGREAVTFLVKVKEALENPVRLTLEI
ncbi:MAG: 2-oxoglutarate dehydrogenase complex dihydrolipoyllysine-residue succinyltransferase [Verrucomicrobia bacterium]|nr:2-oxoglutarate dehydrogenase complex dihydrolipoyllysine-residue succinyltransferase [Verrucomicrobiota bacterium]